MIPIGDSLRSRTTPWVNWLIIALNLLVFFYELTLSKQPSQPPLYFGAQRASQLDRWTYSWGAVPCRLTFQCPNNQNGRAVENLQGPPSELVNLITSMFIHGGWAHILGNMLFLFIFGDNIEDAVGHLGYLLFYLAGGILAGLAQVMSDPAGLAPAVGASGAIAAVLGAYLVTYPRASVQVVIPIIIIPFFTRVPAVIMMGLWFVTQVMSVGAVSSATGGDGGVAYWAHIGGFIAGAVLIFFFRGRRRSEDRDRRYEQYRWEWRR